MEDEGAGRKSLMSLPNAEWVVLVSQMNGPRKPIMNAANIREGPIFLASSELTNFIAIAKANNPGVAAIK